MMHEVLVIGGSGLLGRALCQRLINVGYQVTSLDILAPVRPVFGVQTIVASMLDEDQLVQAMIGEYLCYQGLADRVVDLVSFCH